MFGKNKSLTKDFFSKEEIDFYYYNILIEVFGINYIVEKFLNLYFEDNKKAQDIIRNNLRKFLEIIDAETFSKIKFYFNNDEIWINFIYFELNIFIIINLIIK